MGLANRQVTEFLKGKAMSINAAIRDLDLEVVGQRLIDRATTGREANCPPVPLDQLGTTIDHYRQFLMLCWQFPGEVIVPSYMIGEVWQQHILFLPKYLSDCQKVFGRILDPRPYFTNHDMVIERRDLDATLRLWDAAFGSVPASYDGMTPPLDGWAAKLELHRRVDDL